MPRIPDDIVRERFGQGMTDDEIGVGYPGTSAPYIRVRRIRLGLLRRAGRRSSPGAPKGSRHGSHEVFHTRKAPPSTDNPAFFEKRTIFPSTVVEPIGLNNLLVSGVNSRKIGREITKGTFKGWPIYTLTLEERATCPTSCVHWVDCYGNNMHLAKRVRHGADFERRLEAELTILEFRHPAGFAVRLHILGDFYSVEYVDLWRRFIGQFRGLMVFGFTARWNPADPIAVALLYLTYEKWGRFNMRFSNAPIDECSTISIDHPIQKPADAIICPAQTGKTESCGSCGLCWHSKRRIAFLQH